MAVGASGGFTPYKIIITGACKVKTQRVLMVIK